VLGGAGQARSVADGGDGRHEPGRHHHAGRNLAESLQVAFDAGAKRILLPMSSVTDIPSVPGELFAKFQTSFYSDPVDAVFKALGVHTRLSVWRLTVRHNSNELSLLANAAECWLLSFWRQIPS
jgi:hypothetical protein